MTEQLGPYVLELPDGVFPLGGDSLALGRFATVRGGWRVCDLGCGGATLLLLLAGRAQNLSFTGVELDETSVQAARGNLRRNGLDGTVLHSDLRQADLPGGQFDLVISNPPYFAAGSGKSGGSARHEENCSLDQLCLAAKRLLKNGGRFALCHRPERLCDLMCALREHGLEPKRIQFVAHSPSHAPSTVLVEAVRQGRPGLDVLPLAAQNVI